MQNIIINKNQIKKKDDFKKSNDDLKNQNRYEVQILAWSNCIEFISSCVFFWFI